MELMLCFLSLPLGVVVEVRPWVVQLLWECCPYGSAVIMMTVRWLWVSESEGVLVFCSRVAMGTGPQVQRVLIMALPPNSRVLYCHFPSLFLYSSLKQIVWLISGALSGNVYVLGEDCC